MPDYPIQLPFDVPTLKFPTANNDTYSFRHLYLSQPSTPHEHVAFTRGDEFNNITCLGNPSYEAVKVGDAHEMRALGINFASGEHRQLEKAWGPLWVNDPINLLGTVQVWEIKTSWTYRFAETSTVAGFPAGFQSGDWNWGIGLQFQDANNVADNTYNFMMRFSNADSATYLQTRVRNTFGNVFQGGTTLLQTPFDVMLLAGDVADLRLQIVERVLEHAHIAFHHAHVLDFFVSIAGYAGFRNVGQLVIDVGNINPLLGFVEKPHRIKNIYLGSSFIQNRSFNSVAYQTTRHWDALAYIWNPVGNDSNFIWVY